MSDEKRKPCGEYHPLPCGVDCECGYVTREEDLRDLLEEMREEAALRDTYEGGATIHRFADKLESVIGRNSGVDDG